MFKWMKMEERVAKKNPGLEEKNAATKRKMDVAMSILDKRKEDIPVEIERRKNDLYASRLRSA